VTEKLITEAVGTFFLVLTIGLTTLGGVPWAPVVIGSALMVMVYMGGHISGAHYNPAVTLAMLLRRKISGGDAAAYMIVQFLGAVLAAIAVAVLREEALVVSPSPAASPLQVLLVEIPFTFALVLVVLNVATSPRTEGNSYYGLAIGFTVLVGAAAGGDISGGAFNPAVGLGPAVVGAVTGSGFEANVLLYYFLGPFVGAGLAAWIFRVQHPEEFQSIEG